MRLLRLRLTGCLLMALVAIVALVLAGVRAREHYRRCMRIAATYEMELASDKQNEDSRQRSMKFYRDEARRSRTSAERHRESAGSWRRKAEVVRKSAEKQP